MPIDPGIFELKTVKDLLAKLEHDFKMLEAQPSDSYACFNFFVTAEHMPEWYYRADGEAARELKRKYQPLRVCSQLANGAKHFITRRKRNPSIVETQYVDSNVPGGLSSCCQPHFVIRCDEEAAKELGPEITATDLARLLLEFWRDKVDPRAVDSPQAPAVC